MSRKDNLAGPSSLVRASHHPVMDDKVQLENRKELEDELKVQLESRQDLQFLRDELRAYLDENAFTTTEQQRERVSSPSSRGRTV